MSVLSSFALLTLAAALAPGVQVDAGPDAAGRATQGTRRWLTRGYGYLLEVDGDDLHVLQHSRHGDLPVASGTRLGPSSFEVLGTEVRIVEGASGPRVEWLLTSHGAPLEAYAESPRIVSAEQRGDALVNFDWFCAAFTEHYAFFDERGVDWAAATAALRPRITAEAQPEELFGAMAGLLPAFDDGHVSLSGAARFASGARPRADVSGGRRLGEFARLVEHEYLVGERLEGCGGALLSGRVLDEIGYLRLDAMESLADTAREGSILDVVLGDVEALELGLDAAFEGLDGVTGLVLDVRFNGGGFDRVGLALAARLAREPYLAVRKEVRADPADPSVLAPVGTFRVEPSTRPGFAGPVVLLVSRHTASAAEVFGMSLLARPTPARVVGERSAGAFSDIHEVRLPNGWSLGLSNEVYRMPDGRCFEAQGLPLDLELDVLHAAHLEQGIDPALEAAVELLLDD